MNNKPYRWLLEFLADHRPLWETAMNLGVLLTLVVEIGFPFLVWNRRLRWPFIIMATMMHTMIAVLMGLTVFQLFMVVMLLAYFPPATVKRLVEPIAAMFRRPAHAAQGSHAKAELALGKS